MFNYQLNKRKNKKQLRCLGFTLVEMLISMAIFMTFTGILISSYTGIVRAQRDANSYRDMYVQARQVMETLVQNLRDGMVDYAKPLVVNNGLQDGEMFIISRDATKRSHICYDKGEGVVSMDTINLSADLEAKSSGDRSCGASGFVPLNDAKSVKVSKFRVYFSPKVDPYDPANVNYDTSQFQPRVTIYAEFTKDLGNGKVYTMDLQTTVSSRVYSQVYPTNYLYTNIKK